MLIQFKQKKDFDVVSTGESIDFECQPEHKLVELFAQLIDQEGFPHFLWFSFYDSDGDVLYDKNQTVQQYADQFDEGQAPVILYTPRVTLKFRTIPTDALSSWCLHHGPIFDFAPIPEIRHSAGFDCGMTLSAACNRFVNHGEFTHQTMQFYDCDLQPLFSVYERDLKLTQFFKNNGPVIFLEFMPTCDGDHFNFYLKTSHKPHSGFKEIRWGEQMTVDELSGPNYKHNHSSLLQMYDGNITRIVNGAKLVKELLEGGSANYRLDKFNFNAKTYKHFDVSVRFVNGGDMFTNASSILMWAKAETINSFSKKLLQKMFCISARSMSDQIGGHPINDILNLLIIDVGDGQRRKGNSAVKLRRQADSDVLPVYTVDLMRLPIDLKYCEMDYEFYFYDRTKPSHRIGFKFTKVIGHITDKLSMVVKDFGDKIRLNPQEYDFYSSRDVKIDADSMRSPINEYARKNDLVIYFEAKE